MRIPHSSLKNYVQMATPFQHETDNSYLADEMLNRAGGGFPAKQ